MPSDPVPGRPPPPPPPPGGRTTTPKLPPPQGGGAPPGASDFSQPRRLHPASVVLGVPIGQAIQALVFPVIATLAAPPLFTIVALVGFALIGLLARTLDWRMRTFSFDGEVLRVDHGILSRNHRSLDVSRIQQVEIQRGPLQRVLGLAAIRVETAGSASEPEVDLRVLPEADAVALRTAVRVSQDRLAGRGPAATADGAPDGSDDRGVEVLRVPLGHVIVAALTGARLLVLPAVIGGALQFVGNQVGPYVDRFADRLIELGLAGEVPTVGGPDWRLIALGAVLVLALTMAAAVAVGVVRDGNFRIRQVDEDLHISRGLLATRESVVPLRRVQLVEVRRNWARRALGYASVRIRSAGGSAGGEGQVTVPLLPSAGVDDLISRLLPNVDGVPELHPHPRAALRRALFRWLRPAVFVVAAAYLLPALIDVLDLEVVRTAQPFLLLLLPVNAGLAVVEYRHLAHGATQLVVAARSGALSISTAIAPVVKVQALTSRRSLFQRRLDLTTLHAHVAGPGAVITVLDAGRADAAELHERLTGHAASPIPVVPHGDGARLPAGQR